MYCLQSNFNSPQFYILLEITYLLVKRELFEVWFTLDDDVCLWKLNMNYVDYGTLHLHCFICSFCLVSLPSAHTHNNMFCNQLEISVFSFQQFYKWLYVCKWNEWPHKRSPLPHFHPYSSPAKRWKRLSWSHSSDCRCINLGTRSRRYFEPVPSTDIASVWKP